MSGNPSPNPTPPSAATMRQRAWGGVFVAAVALSLVGGLWLPRSQGSGVALAWAFLGQVAVFLIAIGAAGMAIRGDILGAVIDGRNRPSLSRLQMLLWTVLVLSAVATLVEWRLAHGLKMHAIDVIIPADLLAAMGIATASLVLAPAALSMKPDTGGQAVKVNATGHIRLVDLIRGDENGNGDTIDISKVQQLAITLLLIGLYGALLFDTYWNITWPTGAEIKALDVKPVGYALPILTRSFIELLAISHAGYLLYKAAPKPA